MRALIIALALVTTPLHAEQKLRVDMPGWMTGAWVMQQGDTWADEYWTPPRAGIMIGAARTGTGSKLTLWESTRITHEEDGTLAYWAQPRGVPASKFPMVSQGKTEIIFANAAHDYPQRIRYWREGELLKAEISLMDGSKTYRFNYMPAGGSKPKR
jgi:hypothetical protein